MNAIARPGAASYALSGLLFGAPALIVAEHSFSNHLPLLYSPLVLITWAIPVAGWIYLSSLALGITDQAIYLERFYFQRLEFRFADIAGVSFHSRPRSTLSISVRGREARVSIALAPFSKRSLRLLAQRLKEHVTVVEDQLALTTNQDAS